MFEMTQPSVISAASLNSVSPSETTGLDLLASIQILLIKDYDSQLKGVACQIKGTTLVKKKYREEIENLQNLIITAPAQEVNDQDCIQLTFSEKIALDKNNDYQSDSNGTEVTQTTSREPIEVEKTETPKITDRYLNPKTGKYETRTRNGPSVYWVRKEVIEKKIENYKQKLDSLNEQSELNSLGLQSLTNQRKIAFETISNLVSKHHDGVATIVRNLKS